MSKAPVAIFVYKRKDYAEKCLTSLAENIGAKETDVIVFSDGYKGDSDKEKVLKVREYIHSFDDSDNFKSYKVIEQEKNIGLASSITGGVTKIIEEYGKIIVVEDDLVLSKDFLEFMNDALDFYEKDRRYGEISAYTMPLKILDKYEKDIYAVSKGDCWGWGTWKDRWEEVDWELNDFDKYLKDKKRRYGFSHLEKGLETQLIKQHKGELDAWAARWLFYLYNNNMLTIYPRVCRSINIGFGADASNTGESIKNLFENTLNQNYEKCKFEFLEENKEIAKAIYKVQDPYIIAIVKKIFKKIFK